jgi:hypothetical protein
MPKIVTAAPNSSMVYASTFGAQAVNADVAQSVGVPTKAEFDALVFLCNDLRQTLINAGLAR